MNGAGPSAQSQLALSSGREVNCHGRCFKRGAAYSEDVKLEVAAAYQQAERESGGARPSHTKIAKRFKVDRSFVAKIEGELWVHGRILPPQEIRANADRPVGPGSICMSTLDQYIIVRLYYEDPNRPLHSYRSWLYEYTGNRISTDTISRLLLHGFPYKASLVKPNLIPMDKFKPENEVKAFEYLSVLFDLHPDKILFGDEMAMKPEDVYSQKGRRDPLTGAQPVNVTDSDFRNTLSITAFCSINTQKVLPIWFRIHTDTNNKEEFLATIFAAGRDGFLHPYDVMILDNATIHNDLEEILWREFRVQVLFLPPRAPEWNPKELVWQTLLKRMQNVPLSVLRKMQQDGQRNSIAKVAADTLTEMTFGEVRKYYKHCYKFLSHWQALA